MPAPIFWIKGIIVATKGTLSTIAEKIPENHRIINDVVFRLPPVELIIFLAAMSITPVAIRLSTIINKPMKNRIVAQSISWINTESTFLRLLIISSTKPASIAMVEISILSRD
jgi:hypothetical protein